MERSERQRLEAIKRRLSEGVKAIDELLSTAATPKRLSDRQVKQRALAICSQVRKHGGRVSPDQLKTIVLKHGMPFTAVGALFSGRYLTKRGDHIMVAQPARSRRR
jgi:hypothetical protein